MENTSPVQYRHLSLNIVYYRKLRGLSQDELAEKVNVTKTHISRIESLNNPSMPSLDLLLDIANALDIEIGKLFEIRK